ncbi:Protein kinase-like domain protein [Cordyceps fumosorosea ARSEF 2679]|uniref:Protein kinase-like domain protein n=1 Tax=Cordyceps fumosorosea (strain ARSEF 2679) TaxID=1081104 RepID=A0A167SX06_CORFA|nr:Protein kinase-like domain protein [Cordyceps fumosorosea ARSEF 2679]OAA60017.1 Protein kinase-like domain protein [Cordyceps fumosorosea ARSEF 2679]
MAPAALSLDNGAVEESSSWRAGCEQRKEDYIRSINIRDVCALASYYHHNQPCTEFRERKRGSYNVCYFIEFPNDHTRWVVRFPLTPVLQDAHRKLDCEIATMEYVASKTSVPIPRVRAHGYAGERGPSNPTGKCFLILDYISGEPLSQCPLEDTTSENRDRFYADLAKFYSQMRGLEFDAAGALALGADGTFRITAPLSMDIAAIGLRGTETHTQLQATSAMDRYARQLYSLLLRRAAEPIPEMELLDVQYLVFALQDFENRLHDFTSFTRRQKFVLAHGDLQPSNIILGEDYSITGIIDWEWAGTVPAPFFVPPLWLGKNIAPVANDDDFKDSLSRIHAALVASGSRLATEWPADMHCSAEYYIPAALLNQHFFMTVYYTQLFPLYFGETKQHIKPDSTTMASLKRRAEEAAPAKANKKKRKSKFQAEDESLDTELGLNTLFSRMDNQLLADYLAQKIGRFGTDLSPVEISDITLSANAITDATGFTEQRTLEKLPDFLAHFCKNPDSLGKASKKLGTPHSIIVTGAGLRAADIVRAVRKFASKEIAVAKLFAKHMKVDEQVAFLKKTRVSITVGTPARLSELIDNGALSLEGLHRVVVDASHIDQKKRGVMDMKDTMMPLAKFLSKKEFQDRYTDEEKPLSLLFF